MALRTIAGKEIAFKYSSQEQWTGEYDSDGSKIYTISFKISNFSINKITVNFGIKDIKNLVNIDGAFNRIGYDFAYSFDNIYIGEHRVYTKTGMFEIATNNQYVTLSGTVNLFYTCTNR